MSAHNLDIEFSTEALDDIEDIIVYTRKTWGVSQVARYKALIDNALRVITENPNAGKPRSFFRIYPVGSHRIFYQVTDQKIYVIRVLHERMNTSNRLQEFE